jgi:hypothetical protein
MIRHTKLEPRFVKGVPRDLEQGILYVSMEYGTVVHSCCCGCGQEVVTPLTPTDWKLTFDGESISLWPSVGNWNLPCRSHYVITGNRVIESEPWGNGKIKAEQKRDKAVKAKFYAQSVESSQTAQDNPPIRTVVSPEHDVNEGLLSKLRRWLK